MGPPIPCLLPLPHPSTLHPAKLSRESLALYSNNNGDGRLDLPLSAGRTAPRPAVDHPTSAALLQSIPPPLLSRHRARSVSSARIRFPRWFFPSGRSGASPRGEKREGGRGGGSITYRSVGLLVTAATIYAPLPRLLINIDRSPSGSSAPPLLPPSAPPSAVWLDGACPVRCPSLSRLDGQWTQWGGWLWERLLASSGSSPRCGPVLLLRNRLSVLCMAHLWSDRPESI